MREALAIAIERGRAVAEGSGDMADYSASNMQFHEAIYAGCRNELLAQQVRPLRRLIQRYKDKNRQLQTAAKMKQSVASHEKIAQAILSGDEALAYRLMLEHVPAGGSGFSEFLSALPTSLLEDTVAA